MKTITIANQKGGVGKTTTALNVASELTAQGYSVLLIDLDPQCNLTFGTGYKGTEGSIYEVLKGQVKILDLLIEESAFTPFGRIIAGSETLSAFDLEFTKLGKEYLLREKLSQLPDGGFDYCIVDVPPTLGYLLINALTASDSVIIPLNTDAFSIQGVSQLLQTISTVQQYTNKDLQILGAVITNYNGNTTISKQLKESVREQLQELGVPFFTTCIRSAVAIREAHLLQTPLIDHAPNSKPRLDYIDLVNELLKEI